jgi:hypothetical protein
LKVTATPVLVEAVESRSKATAPCAGTVMLALWEPSTVTSGPVQLVPEAVPWITSQ